MLELFVKGGPIMWPILILSVISSGVVIERIIFLFNESKNRNRSVVNHIFQKVEHDELDEVIQEFSNSPDMVARVLINGLEHRDISLSDAMLEAASTELDRYNRGLVVLDTAVTLGPLLGLLGTVIGMMNAFNVVGAADIASKQAAITGGVAECLIAVTFGLGVAIVSIIPLNYLNARLEKARRELESSMTRLELLVAKQKAVLERF